MLKKNIDDLKSRIQKLLHISDSPQRIALGFGLGVFMGMMPFVGPVAAFVFAWIFRVNRLAAVTGGLLTNSWISLLSFVLALKIGSALTGSSWEDVYERCKALLHNFHWRDLLSVSIREILRPMLLGYFILGLIFGALSYGAVLVYFKKRVRRKSF